MRIVDLTQPWGDRMPTWPQFASIEVTDITTHHRDGKSTMLVKTNMHTGTHIDAPYHFFPDGATIDRVPLDRRLEFVDRVLDVAPGVRNLAKLLVVKRRVPLGPRVAELFARLADEQEGVIEAEVATAAELTPELRERIERALVQGLGGRSVRLSHRVDPSLLGGIVIRVGDKLVDGSVRTRLRLLRQHLAAAP